MYLDLIHCNNMSTQLTDPLVLPLLQLYRKHQGYFYINHFRNFKLFASWLLEEDLGTYPINDAGNAHLPWFAGNYELQELAKYLKVSQGTLFKFLMEHWHE